ncbi:MAG: ATP-binding protein [Ferrovibrio sp.]|uniref:AAA family ATPase n=1 Tax=Ferrovibrio sp. TaxID=1917215 RepID=UPI002604CA6F|nr:ATP-binding protein [Ferrovibrio sp.]MCW0234734.1 ATP-binding protein [Ferrovibrio sp.]
MARSDLLISLVKASAAGDRETLKSTVEAMVADERAKSHHGLADRLQKALNTVAVSPPSLVTSHSVNNAGREAILERDPQVSLDDLILPLPARRTADQLIEEHRRATVLRAHGMEPRHRVLLSGPPGNGKTSYAEAIAEALALPLFVIRYDVIVGSFLGETNTRLRRLFDYVRTQPCVLFFDEFDAIGKERGDEHETGEIKRVVSFLLMQLDQLPSYVVAIAATNHAELLDRAVWRRFEVRLQLPQPDQKVLAEYVDRQISRWPERPKVAANQIATQLGNTSFAETLDFLQNVRRRSILGLGETHVDVALKTEMELWASRVKPIAGNGERSNKTAAPSGSTTKRKASDRKRRPTA